MVIGVDTHKHVYVAVAHDAVGGCLEARSLAADRSGYDQLLDWALAFSAKQLTFAIGAPIRTARARQVPHPRRRERFSRRPVRTSERGGGRPLTAPWRCCARSRLPRTPRSTPHRRGDQHESRARDGATRAARGAVAAEAHQPLHRTSPRRRQGRPYRGPRTVGQPRRGDPLPHNPFCRGACAGPPAPGELWIGEPDSPAIGRLWICT